MNSQLEYTIMCQHRNKLKFNWIIFSIMKVVYEIDIISKNHRLNVSQMKKIICDLPNNNLKYNMCIVEQRILRYISIVKDNGTVPK